MTSKTANAVDVKGMSVTSRASNDDSTRKTYGIKDHWKCLAACTMVSMCPFQYGMSLQLPKSSVQVHTRRLSED